MKISIDCRMLNNSGIGNVLKNILAHLPTEHNYLLIGNEKELAEYEKENTKILSCNIPIFSLKEFFMFPIKDVNKCDVYFTPNYNIPSGIRCRKFCFIHDLLYLDMPELTTRIKRTVLYLYAIRAVKICKKVFTVSEFSKSRISHYFGNVEKIQKIIVSIPESFRKYLKTFGENEISKSEEDFFLFVGNVKKHKGLDILIKAFELLNDKDIKLYIVGKKDSFQTGFTEILNCQNPNIVFTGYLSNTELYECYRNAKAVIQPSYYEGFGIPPLEALYLGTSVILSDIDVFKEIYGNLPVIFFKSGDVNDLSEKMKSIVSDKVSVDVLDKMFDFNRSVEIIFSEIVK
jgi:glycosyltransferase involved in cell wall biosynthesis